MPRRVKPSGGGRDDGHAAARAHGEMKEQLARVRDEVRRTRDETLRITAAIAETEQQLAATLRLMAETARADGHPLDAERLARYADEAQRFAAAEEQRVSGG
jgi:hypothetical protein